MWPAPTSLWQLPVAGAAAPLAAPLPVVETPEVAAAREEHAKAHVKAKAAVAASHLVAAEEKYIGNKPLCPTSNCCECYIAL